MAITSVTYYSVSVKYDGSTKTTAESSVNAFACDGYDEMSDNATNYPKYARFYYITVGSKRLYVSTGTVTWGSSGQDWFAGGTTFGTQIVTVFGAFSTIVGYKVFGDKATAVGSSRSSLEGSRTISITAGAYGSGATPSIGSGKTIVSGTYYDIAAHADCVYVSAGTGNSSRGTLLTQGYYGVWDKWSWSPAVVTTGGDSHDNDLTFSLLPGYDDTTITATFRKVNNSASLWCPGNGNVVIHLLDAENNEEYKSTDYLTNLTSWKAFRALAFSGYSCGSGTLSQAWYTSYTTGVYLMNVAEAVFGVLPIAGRTVYKWEVWDSIGEVIKTYASANIVTISDIFEEGCSIHLYLTRASAYPSIVYDGFDTAEGSDVPTNENVLVDGATGGGVVKTTGWASTSSDPITKTLSPVAWATRVLGQERSVIVGSGTPQLLENVDGTSATIVSSAEQYSVTHVKFKQAVVPKSGVLSVTIVEDTITPLTSISVGVSQEGTLLKTVTAANDTVEYYAGSGSLKIAVVVNYGIQKPSDFVVTVKPAVVYDGDVTDGTSLDATATTRAVTVSVVQVVNFGALTAVDINLTRDTSVGTLIAGATSSGPTTQCSAGSITVAVTAGQSSATPIYIECSANNGYTLKSIRIVDGLTGTNTFYAGPAPSQVTPIKVTLLQEYDNVDIKVILVLSAVIVGTPSIKEMLPDDLGKFAATVTSVGGYADFRVGDSVRLAVAPVGGATVAIGTPTFNDDSITPVRDGTSITATAILRLGTNVFKVPAYVVFETTSSPAEAGTIALATTWDVVDTLVISAVTYRRLGYHFTVTAPLTSTSPSTYTVVHGSLGRRATTPYYDYVEVGIIAPVVASVSTRTFYGTLSGPTKLTAVYAIGSENPTMAFAAYDYGAGAYITAGVRPGVTTTPVSPAVLSDNIVGTVTWPEIVPDDTDYTDAAFLVRSEATVDTPPLLPQVNIQITSTVSSRLEIWNAATGLWFPYSPVGATLSEDFTFFRVAVGDPPENLVTVTFETAEKADETAITGCSVYATSGITYDGNFKLPATMTVRSRTVLHVRVTPPGGYVVIGWYISSRVDESGDPIYVLESHGASLSVVVPDSGLNLKPLLALRTVAASTVTILNGDPNLTDEGIWVSKLFRAQEPWKPLTATVVVKPTGNPVMLAVLKDGGDAPTVLDPENPGLGAAVIRVTDDKMRRLPPTQIQKTRFVRYMLLVTGAATVVSAAIGSGAQTMKGGH